MAGDETQTHLPKSNGREHLPTRPPGEVPGYSPIQFLGSGAYGEVWVAQDDTTGRKVAIKFFLHQRSVDWSLLAREVEKLVFLSADRYVVQLLDVGWEAEPPYFVMEYMERGSLEDYLEQRGTLPVEQAVDIFRDVARGLSHAHSKGVLHCDLKPANLLLDQDERPRLADFGQSRLASEQNPALGTLFYMAPEQADLEAVPDATWDVYALGCLLHKMLTGAPPYRDDAALAELAAEPNLEKRLGRYQEILRDAPSLDAHLLPGVDRPLAEIMERCLAIDPKDRFRHILGVLGALAARERKRLRRPLWLMGIVGPLLLLLTMGAFGYRFYDAAIQRSERMATKEAQRSNQFASDGAARNVASQLEQRFRTLGNAARDNDFRPALRAFLGREDVQAQLKALAEPATGDDQAADVRNAFVNDADRVKLTEFLRGWLNDVRLPSAASWFIVADNGTMIATAFKQAPSNPPEGHNFSYRTYFHGGERDLDDHADRSAKPLRDTHISTPFQSTATGDWKVAISTPVVAEGETLAVLAMTVLVGEFVRFDNTDVECALLVDARNHPKKGMILQHPVFLQIRDHGLSLPDLSDYRVDVEQLADPNVSVYRDPISADALGEAFQGDWIVAASPVVMDRVTRTGLVEPTDTGLMLLVQKRLAITTEPVVQLGRVLLREALLALGTVLGVVGVLWYFVAQSSRKLDSTLPLERDRSERDDDTIHSRETLEHPFPDKLS